MAWTTVGIKSLNENRRNFNPAKDHMIPQETDKEMIFDHKDGDDVFHGFAMANINK